jgi:hypothetical protein
MRNLEKSRSAYVLNHSRAVEERRFRDVAQRAKATRQLLSADRLTGLTRQEDSQEQQRLGVGESARSVLGDAGAKQVRGRRHEQGKSIAIVASEAEQLPHLRTGYH